MNSGYPDATAVARGVLIARVLVKNLAAGWQIN